MEAGIAKVRPWEQLHPATDKEKQGLSMNRRCAQAAIIPLSYLAHRAFPGL